MRGTLAPCSTTGGHRGTASAGRGSEVLSTMASGGQEPVNHLEKDAREIQRRHPYAAGRQKGIRVLQQVTWQGGGGGEHDGTSRGEYPTGESWVCFRAKTAFVNKGVPNFCLSISFFWW